MDFSSASVRIQALFDSNGLMPNVQSAYRRHHSTETAVFKCSTICCSQQTVVRCQLIACSTLLQRSTIVDHELLLHRLERQFGLCSIVLEWFRSYLSGRSFRVVFRGCTSSIIYIICSVPQGSVLGPLLFITYTADLEAVAEKHGEFLHTFADDTQIVVASTRRQPPPNWNAALQTSATGCPRID